MPDNTPKPSEAIERVRQELPRWFPLVVRREDLEILLAEYDRLCGLMDEVKAALEPCVRWSQADRVLHMDPLHLKPMAELHARLTGDSGASPSASGNYCSIGNCQIVINLLRKELDQRRFRGTMMANICFNGKQSAELPQRFRDSMAESHAAWDKIERVKDTELYGELFGGAR